MTERDELRSMSPEEEDALFRRISSRARMGWAALPVDFYQPPATTVEIQEVAQVVNDMVSTDHASASVRSNPDYKDTEIETKETEGGVL